MPVRLALLALALFALPARTQTPDPEGRAPIVAGQIGIMVLSLPRYPGSDQRWIVPVPLVDVRVARRWYVGDGLGGLSAATGVYLVERGGFFWSADLALTSDRPESRTAALAGMGDRGFGVFGGTTAGLRVGPLEATAAVGLGLEDAMGMLGTVGLTAAGPLAARWFGQVGGAAVFGDCANLRWDFGVSGAQGARRAELLEQDAPGLRPGDETPYTPACGLRELRATAALGYALSARWSVLASGTGVKLERGAAASPLTRNRNDWEAGLGLAWRF